MFLVRLRFGGDFFALWAPLRSPFSIYKKRLKPQMITETKDEVTTIEGKNVHFGDATIDELRYYEFT